MIEVLDDGPGFATGWDLAYATGTGLGLVQERLHEWPGATLDARTAPEGGAWLTLRLPPQS